MKNLAAYTSIREQRPMKNLAAYTSVRTQRPLLRTWQRMSILEKQGPTYISITASVRHIAHHSDQTR